MNKCIHERNYGCRIKEYIYNGLKTITMENEIIKVSLLVDKGTDIFEFMYKPKDVDYMFRSFNGIKKPSEYIPTSPNLGGPFLDYYEGGWQEIFPNISDPCEYMGANLGIHGEVDLLPWKYKIEKNLPEEIQVKFWVRTLRTPYYLEKILIIKGQDPTLYFDESVTNEGSCQMQFMWGHHPALGGIFLDENCVIEFPQNCKSKVIDVVGLDLEKDLEIEWPNAKYKNGSTYDLSKVPCRESKISLSYYLYDINDGWYKVKNTKKEIGFEMNWDKDIFNNIFVWGEFGGAQQYPWYGRNYNLAIEPWSALPGNLAQVAQANKGIKIDPDQTINTQMSVKAYQL